MRRAWIRTLPNRMATGGLALAWMALGGCSAMEVEEKIAERARVVVEGTAPVPLELITSTKFTRTILENGAVQIVLSKADTTFISPNPPFDRTFPVKPDWGFYVRLRNPVMTPAVVSMRVYFDGELTFNHRNITLQDASIDFSYIFTNYTTVR